MLWHNHCIDLWVTNYLDKANLCCLCYIAHVRLSENEPCVLPDYSVVASRHSSAPGRVTSYWKSSVVAYKPNSLAIGSSLCFSYSTNSQGTKNSSTKYSSIKCSSTNFNGLNSLITFQVQEFKLQAQETKFQAQAFQVSSTSFKFKTEKRFYITLTLKRGQRPKSFSQP